MGESILLIHIVVCAYRTVIYGVVIVSRKLERANENDGFQMTAFKYGSCAITGISALPMSQAPTHDASNTERGTVKLMHAALRSFTVYFQTIANLPQHFSPWWTNKMASA